ncbi:hypothetical protein DSO57_1039643 [Entomophthora muscae]|uniref:Uncharacterized protein n=1 Tax=Entomophthora muscae TaxID=34485 RepID=A0ACC2S9W6_9FUNG|nr:hypothetical protein DSO57_1039643 [Entomophthora muscae]
MLLWLIQLLPYFVFAVYKFSFRSPGPPAPLPAVFCPPGAPFGPVHFTDYSLKPKYKDYTPEKIIELDPLACIQSAIRYNCQGLWIFSTPKLFRGKIQLPPGLQRLYGTTRSIKTNVSLFPQPANQPYQQAFWYSVHHPHWGVGHHCTGHWPMVLVRKFCFLCLKS